MFFFPEALSLCKIFGSKLFIVRMFFIAAKLKLKSKVGLKKFLNIDPQFIELNL